MDFSKEVVSVDQQEVDDRLNDILSNTFSDEEKATILRQIVSMIDLTTLNGDDTLDKVVSLCEKGVNTEDVENKIPRVGAICVYPNFAGVVSDVLQDTGINTAVVATGFPSGQTFLNIKLMETEQAVNEGADEVDMVISRGKFLEQAYDAVYAEIEAVKKACNQAHLKVILETGELQNLTNVRFASQIAIAAGADFIKTSTGKIKPAATLDAFLVMTDVIKEHYKKTGKKIGIKPAGGISDADTALKYYRVVKENLGEEWLNNSLFRIGASSLLDNILLKIKN